MNGVTSATLVPVTNPGSITQRYSYQYDKAGNRVSHQIGNQVTSATHDSANRLTGTAGGGKLLVAGSTDEPANEWGRFSRINMLVRFAPRVSHSVLLLSRPGSA